MEYRHQMTSNSQILFSQPRVDGGQNHAPTFGIFSFYQVVDRCQQWNFIGWLTLKHWHGRDLKITKFEGTFNFTRLKVRSLLLMFCSLWGDMINQMPSKLLHIYCSIVSTSSLFRNRHAPNRVLESRTASCDFCHAEGHL